MQTGADPSLSAAVRAIAGRCDGAQTLDGIGYSGTDTHFGRSLAMLSESEWPEGAAVEAHKMLRKYRGQLESVGIDYDAIPVPVDDRPVSIHVDNVRERTNRIARPLVDLADSTVEFTAGWFIIRFPYCQERVGQVKAVPGARWDGAERYWRVPHDSGRALYEVFAEFTWTPEAKEATQDAPEPKPAKRIELAGSMFHLTFPYDPGMVKAIKPIPGAHWDKLRKVWAVGTTPPAARGLLAFAETWDVAIFDDAREKLTTESGEAEKLVESSRALDHSIDIPGLGGELRPFQKAGVAYARATRRTFIADEMGLGKTVQALATIHAEQSYPAIIVAPTKMRTKWAMEAIKWLPADVRVAVVVPPSTPDKQKANLARRGILPMPGAPRPGAADIYIVGWRGGLYGHVDAFIALGARTLVLDESHFAKSRDRKKVCPDCRVDLRKADITKRECRNGHKFTGRPGSAYKTIDVEAAWSISASMPADAIKLCLSGTPNKNTVSDYVSQLAILGRLDEFGGEWPFLKRYCGAWQDNFGWHTDGASNLPELNERLRATCFVRRRKADVMPDLPPVDRQPLEVDVDDLSEYEKAEADIVEFLAKRAAELAAEAGEDERAASWEARMRAEAAEHLVRITTLKRLAAKAKMPMVEEWVSDFLRETDRKLIIFAHHTEVVNGLADTFGCPRIVGGISDAESDAAVARFQDDPACRVIVIGITAGGVGLTLTAASDELFVEMVWTPTDHDQAEARAYGRLNDAHGVTATYVIANDTIDADTWALLEDKREVFHAAADGTPMTSNKASVLGDLLVGLAKRGQKESAA